MPLIRVNLVVATIVTLALGCGGPVATTDAGNGGGSATGGSAASGGGSATGGGTADACVPLTCAAAPSTCGTVPDGCGGSLNCAPCACTPSTFATDCPSRPCETATGCVANTCQHQAVTCGFDLCSACVSGADGGCGDTDLRACGSGCAANYCDPALTMVSGVPVYGNTCVPRANVQCGVCGLGAMTCAPDGGAASCNGVTLVDVNPALIECNGGSPSATIIFLDPATIANTHDGSKTAPFLSLAEAQSAAAARQSRAIVIAGSPTFDGGLTLDNGVSVLGGFSTIFVRDESRRPVFAVPLASLTNGQVVGLSASDISVATLVSDVDVEVPGVAGAASTAGASTIGAWLSDAGLLTLSNVHFVVGHAQAGGAGAPGPAAKGTSSVGGAGAPSLFSNSACIGLPATFGPVAGGTVSAPSCGNGLTSALDPNGLGGAGAGSAKIDVFTQYTYFTGSPAPFVSPDAGPGAAGGTGNFDGVNTYTPGPGTDAVPWPTNTALGASGVASLTWTGVSVVPQGRGATGPDGRVGRGGGGGGSGFTHYNNCNLGGGGGGGGAGGCGGYGGAGGAPGGWALGVVISGPWAPTLVGVTVTLDPGGAGGAGGAGTGGLPGASGGPGGTSTIAIYQGAAGGKGAPGQNGGVGGAGADGQTRGVLCRPGVTLPHPVDVLATPASMTGFVLVDGC